MTQSPRRVDYLRAMGVDVWVRRVGAQGEVRDTRREAESTLTTRAQHPVSLQPLSLDWASLEVAVKTCTQCELHRARTQAVFGVGDKSAQWMIIGEAPGADEDAQGEPFVGAAGLLLNAMLKAIGLRREQVYIANLMKCHPPQDRDPTVAQAACCQPFLQRQIELVNPKLILCLGRIAAQKLLNTDEPLAKLRGQVHRLGEARRPLIATYHPAYLLRSPGEKRRAWEDLLLAMATFDTTLPV